MEITNKIINANNMDTMKNMPDNCVDTIITDAPYAIKFKNKKWDYSLPSVKVLTEMLRVIKHGGTMLIFGGTRTFHRLAVNIEDAGWNISDTICWIHGQGFPKSVDISYMIDKKRGKFGKIKYEKEYGNPMESGHDKKICKIPEPYDELSRIWNGWGTALKPAWEPILVCNKPIIENYEDSALSNKVAGYWIDGARIKTENVSFGIKRTSDGRWPSNLFFDEDTIYYLDNQDEKTKKVKPSRFFYCAKPTKKEKSEYNNHATVKPVHLMTYLCTLTRTPYGGLVFDPFAGTGTTGLGAIKSNRNYLLIEQELESFNIMEKRINECLRIND